ncbi:hypothetical protein [Actinoplanes couchii]|uniref:Uncharacterized protein n=1 Tax=Actinoplanes couchii TaxID=403638 RepID=A0ABQ3X058_9ACTN|nr:hypothetical protein [Actinoplanes couchii]MDR6316228.1 hypothetical protein [Actinoplanes couchii]GID51842.1 hypothetical protein Aco03nite_002460 [Actinoplanes couchii]
MEPGWSEILDRINARAAVGARWHEPTGARIVDRDDNADAVEVCIRTLEQATALGHIARYTFGSPDYTVDLLAQRAEGPDDALLNDVNEAGRNLYDYMLRFNDELSGLRTGALIRFFLSAELGTVHWYEVTDAQHLIAVSFAPSAESSRTVPADRIAIDQEVTRLANRLRRSLSQQPVDYGGWLAAESKPDDPPPPVAATGTGTGRVDPHVAGRLAPVAARCAEALDLSALHYAAVYHRDEQVAAADILGHPGLHRFDFGTNPEFRRAGYGRLGPRLGEYARDLTAMLYRVSGRRITYFVLDVARGAVFFHRLRPRTHLVAVTLDQDRVVEAEREVLALAGRLADQWTT